MAYTYTVDPSTPTGATAANTADEEFRNLKGAFIERLNHLVGGASFDINSDPIVPAGARMLDPTVTTQFLMTPYASIKSPTAQFGIYGAIDDFTIGGAGSFVIPLWFKPGVLITDITLHFSRGDIADVVNMALYNRAWGDPASLLYSTAAGGTLIDELVLPCSNHQIVAGMPYWVNVNYEVVIEQVILEGIEVQLV
jgi:hypothetical protein